MRIGKIFLLSILFLYFAPVEAGRGQNKTERRAAMEKKKAKANRKKFAKRKEREKERRAAERRAAERAAQEAAAPRLAAEAALRRLGGAGTGLSDEDNYTTIQNYLRSFSQTPEGREFMETLERELNRLGYYENVYDANFGPIGCQISRDFTPPELFGVLSDIERQYLRPHRERGIERGYTVASPEAEPQSPDSSGQSQPSSEQEQTQSSLLSRKIWGGASAAAVLAGLWQVTQLSEQKTKLEQLLNYHRFDFLLHYGSSDAARLQQIMETRSLDKSQRTRIVAFLATQKEYERISRRYRIALGVLAAGGLSGLLFLTS